MIEQVILNVFKIRFKSMYLGRWAVIGSAETPLVLLMGDAEAVVPQ